MKKIFSEPEMEVVRFNAQEIVTAASMNICTEDVLNGCSSEGIIFGD